MKQGYVFMLVLMMGLVGGCATTTTQTTIPDQQSEQAQEFVDASQSQIGVVTSYDFSNGYYGSGGFPPEDTGVCTDVIRRAYRDMGLDFKSSLIDHQQKHPELYDNFGDSNISFRRVKNINTYLTHVATILTNELMPGDETSLIQWQAGDIVIFDALPPKNLWHIGVIGDRRRHDGVPYMIDNHGSGVDQVITPLDWPTDIVGHYRIF